MGYFASDEEEKARRYDFRQKGKATQQHLATLEGELKHFAAAWYDLAQYGRNPESVTFTVTDDQITVQRDTKPITAVLLRYFDAE
ncbi:MAG TPA: hypothetical protein VJQ59_15170, partial [Candidatus Sulfotelmatobacter sp.]|nr:hypothetical protein [Candidatus Sulfotelmatobacter sp.]